MHWQVWIDTGGTFTDCIAIDPKGETKRVKVLSSSRLRGTLLEKTAPGAFRIEQRWICNTDIYQDYDFRLLDRPDLTATVRSVQPADTGGHSLILLDRDMDVPLPAGFEIGAGEEAPVLAARLVTGTPLRRPFPPIAMRLGTTKGTNALLEKKGAKVVLCITKGFADLPAIGAQQRPHLFQLDIPGPELLYERVLEIDERIDAEGNVLLPLRQERLQEIAAAAGGAGSVAIALLHSYRNPAHENLLAGALHAAGHRYVSASAALSPSVKLLLRAQTAIVNAYLEPVLDSYLASVRQSLHSAGQAGESGTRFYEKGHNPSVTLHVMTSAGGLVHASHYRAKDSLLSGPAGGVVGSANIARKLGFERILTLDMGGTSTDSARYDGRYDYRFVTRVGQAEMLSPGLDIETVAAGGGSICYFDGRKLCVGPESAGAQPGPACYGAGGPLTLTDVNLLLGKLEPSAMGIPIFPEKARATLQKLHLQIETAGGEKYSPEALLRGFEQIADERMAGAIRRISVARGFDPREYALLAFGGAGGLHACRIAELLDIDTVILPYDAGLLSAYGIGHALVERFAERQVLQLLDECRAALPQIVGELSEQAFSELEEEGLGRNHAEVLRRLLRMRFYGQDSTIEIDWDGRGDPGLLFETQYRNLFGHYPAGRAVEMESMRVVCALSRETIVRTTGGSPGTLFRAYDNAGVVSPGIRIWDALTPGDRIAGPVVLSGSHAAAWIAPGWALEVREERHAVLTRMARSTVDVAHGQEVELELFTNRFSAIAEEMGAQLQRTAFSVNVKERLDFSCAVLDSDAELLVNAPHIPVHLGSLGVCARMVLDKLPLGPGDVILTNHPRYGGSHLPDVTLLSAVFSDEGTRIGYVVNRAHHAEIGGKRPGSMPPDARVLEEEGVVIAPMYLIKSGAAQWDAVERIFTQCAYPTRALPENMADLNAALAALRAGTEALQALARMHGVSKVRHYMSVLKEMAANALDEAIAGIPPGEYRAVERLDDGSAIAAGIRLQNGELDFDFTGTAPVHPFNLNANISIVYSVVLYVLRLLVKKEIPLNEGLMRRVRIRLPEGSLLHPRFDDDGARCPAVVGGNTEVSQRLTDTLLKALGVAACSQGTMNNFLFGNARFGYYETIGGGVGAGPGFVGRSAVHQHMTNTRITDVEEMELRYPVRLLQFAIRRGSGGAGLWRGGDGIVREFEFLEAVEMTLLSQHRVEAPYGIQGGAAGMAGAQYLIHPDGREEPLAGIDSRTLQPGQRVRLETPGGGACGSSPF